MKEGTGTITVIVKPNAKKDAFLGFDEGRDAFRVAIKAPAEKGQANRAAIRFLSRHFGKKAVLISGATSRTKRFRLG